DGHIEEALTLCEKAAARAQELGVIAYVDATRLRLYLGRGTEKALEAAQSPVRLVLAVRALLLSYVGRHEEAHAIRERFGDIGSDEDESAAHILLNLFEAAILGADEDTV